MNNLDQKPSYDTIPPVWSEQMYESVAETFRFIARVGGLKNAKDLLRVATETVAFADRSRVPTKAKED